VEPDDPAIAFAFSAAAFDAFTTRRFSRQAARFSPLPPFSFIAPPPDAADFTPIYAVFRQLFSLPPRQAMRHHATPQPCRHAAALFYAPLYCCARRQQAELMRLLLRQLLLPH